MLKVLVKGPRPLRSFQAPDLTVTELVGYINSEITIPNHTVAASTNIPMSKQKTWIYHSGEYGCES